MLYLATRSVKNNKGSLEVALNEGVCVYRGGGGGEGLKYIIFIDNMN